MKSDYLNLMQFFEGYVQNYRSLNLSELHNVSMFTMREIDYFSRLGSMLGFYTYIEDAKPNHEYGQSRPMDLSWWRWDARKDPENFTELALHLERENSPARAGETINKLFSETDPDYVPKHVIGIQFVESVAQIDDLNQLVAEKNKVQGSRALMIYRCYDPVKSTNTVSAFVFDQDGIEETRKAVCMLDQTGYHSMVLAEDVENSTEDNFNENPLLTYELDDKGEIVKKNDRWN